MRDTSFLHFLYQPLFGCLLAYYVLETEHGLISYKLLLVTLPVVNCQLLIVHCLVDLFGYFPDAVCGSYRVEVEAWDAMGYQLFALLLDARDNRDGDTGLTGTFHEVEIFPVVVEELGHGILCTHFHFLL